MAERQGFEPWRRFPAYTLSRRAPSTTRPPLRIPLTGYARRRERGYMQNYWGAQEVFSIFLPCIPTLWNQNENKGIFLPVYGQPITIHYAVLTGI